MPLNAADALRRLSDEATLELNTAILETAEELSSNAIVSDIAAALRTGNPARALARLPMERVIARLRGDLARIVRQVYEGAVAVAPLPREAEEFRNQFNITNPEAVNYIRAASLNTALNIRAEIEDAVRQAVMRGFQEGIHPYDIARSIRHTVGLTDFGTRAVENYAAFLDDFNARVSGGRAILSNAADRLARGGMRGMQGALRTGLTEERKARLIAKYRDKLIRGRANTIARTVTIDASNAGQNALWSQAQSAGYLNQSDWEVKWIVAKDERTCPKCKAMEKMRRSLYGTYPNGVGRPTLHPNCRCSEGLVRRTASRRWAA